MIWLGVEKRKILRECGCDHVKTSSYPCNTSSDVFSIKSVTSARLCLLDPKPACAVRHRQEISRKKKRLRRYWIMFFY